MDPILLAILIIMSIMLSAIFEQVLPRVSLPLVQIGMGLLIAFSLNEIVNFQIEPDLFLLLFVSPLLFEETRQADKLKMWQNKGGILSLAIGLVVATTLAAGFLLNIIEPSITLAACFALCAALGPTDAVAVSALSSETKVSKRQQALLSGESLLNDASGVVSFQFAVAALTTGAFSLENASLTFIISFFGGITIGILVGFAVRILKNFLQNHGLSSSTVSIGVELLLPFIIFLLGEHLQCSGVLAVVAAGFTIHIRSPKVNVAAAHYNILSGNVWKLVVFLLNGLIFLYLGMRLKFSADIIIQSNEINIGKIIFLIFFLTFVIYAIRFVWILVLDIIENRKNNYSAYTTKHLIKDSLVTTIAGPKGAVTLAIILSLPITLANGAEFHSRDLIILLASGVILLTLLAANFILPILAPQEDTDAAWMRLRDAHISIMKKVINDLRNSRTLENRRAVDMVIKQYFERMKRTREKQADNSYIKALRVQILEEQSEVVHKAVLQKRVSPSAGQHYSQQLKHLRRAARRGQDVTRNAENPWRRPWIALLPKTIQRMLNKTGLDAKEISEKSDMRYLILECEKRACEFLEVKVHDRDRNIARAASLLLLEHRPILESLKKRFAAQETGMLFGREEGPIINPKEALNVLHEQEDMKDIYLTEVQANAFRQELFYIQQARDRDEITREMAHKLRDAVYLLQMDNEKI